MIFTLALLCGLGLMAIQSRLLMRYLDKGPDRSDQIAALAIAAVCVVPAVLTVNGMLPQTYDLISFVILGAAAAMGTVTGLASQMTISERRRSGRFQHGRHRRQD